MYRSLSSDRRHGNPWFRAMIGAMYLVLIAWGYVALMMAAAEALAPNGSLLGAIVTFVLYGLVPIGLIGYLLDAPRRRRVRAAADAIERASANTPDTGREAPGPAGADPVAPVREEP